MVYTMNYNDFFKSALSAAYQKNPMTDDDAFISIIKERAKEMKKEDNLLIIFGKLRSRSFS